jgi:hypothetical protein
MKPGILFAVGALALASAAISLADEWNQKTVITFATPVSIPAVHQPGYGVLPAGTYVFKVMGSLSDRNIVQIFNADETKIYATILAISDIRLKVTDKAVITFRETPAGQPMALRAMFYPGRETGHEFVYPRAQATELARETHEAVMSMPEEIKAEEAKPEAPEVIAELEQTPVTPVEPQVAELALPPAPMATEAPAQTELPQTASPLPLLSLLGLLTLSGGLGLRYAEKRLR